MESPLHQRGVREIDATVEMNRSIIPGLIATHALSGCDTMTSYYGISKGPGNSSQNYARRYYSFGSEPCLY